RYAATALASVCSGNTTMPPLLPSCEVTGSQAAPAVEARSLSASTTTNCSAASGDRGAGRARLRARMPLLSVCGRLDESGGPVLDGEPLSCSCAVSPGALETPLPPSSMAASRVSAPSSPNHLASSASPLQSVVSSKLDCTSDVAALWP